MGKLIDLVQEMDEHIGKVVKVCHMTGKNPDEFTQMVYVGNFNFIGSVEEHFDGKHKLLGLGAVPPILEEDGQFVVYNTYQTPYTSPYLCFETPEDERAALAFWESRGITQS